MNLFVLDLDHTVNAQCHVNSHVVKMPLEAAQIAATVLREVRGIDTRYKSTHKHHPCVKWAGESEANLAWVLAYGQALCTEYTYRYGKVHGCAAVLAEQGVYVGQGQAVGLAPHAQAMPDEYRVSGDAVAAYRSYYIGAKQHIAAWKNRPMPEWFITRPNQ